MANEQQPKAGLLKKDTVIKETALKETLAKVVSATKRLDPKAEVLVRLEALRRANVRFSANEVSTSGEGEESRLSITIQLGQRAATITSNQTDDASVARTVERGLRLAQLAPVDPELMPVLGTQPIKRVELAFDPRVDALDAKARAGIVAAALEPGRAQGLITAGFLSMTSGFVGRATSAGLMHLHPATSLELSLTARTPSATGSGRAQFSSRRLEGLNAESIAKEACATAKASENPRRLEPGRYTVILEGAATATLVESLMSAMNQRSADEGRSFFSKPPNQSKVGERLFSEHVTLRSNPKEPKTPMLPFDTEGRALDAQNWITNGRLEALGTTRYWAKRTNKPVIGGHSGYELTAGTVPRARLLENVTRGVLISRFWYTNWVEPQNLLLTGLTRDGTFLIENGRIVAPVNNFRFNQSVAEAFLKCDALSSELSAVDVDAVAPAMRTHDFLLASSSEAI